MNKAWLNTTIVSGLLVGLYCLYRRSVTTSSFENDETVIEADSYYESFVPEVDYPSFEPTFEKPLTIPYEKLQLTITNLDAKSRAIRLWGSNSDESISPPYLTDVVDHEIQLQWVSGGGAPPPSPGAPPPVSAPFLGLLPSQQIIQPINGFFYVANRGSNNVTVLDPDGQYVRTINIFPILLSFAAPTAMTTNDNPSSIAFGKVYLAGSISDSIAILDADDTPSNQIGVGNTPLGIAYNSVNDLLYVTNRDDDTVSVIDVSTELIVGTIPVGNSPLGIAINPVNGDWYVANSGDNTVSIFDSSNVAISTIPGVGNTPVSVQYHPLNNEMYVVSRSSNEVFPINATTYLLLPSIPTGNSPYAITYNEANEYLYIGNQADATLTVIAPDKSIVATIAQGAVNQYLIFHPETNNLLVSDTGNHTLKFIGYSSQTSLVSIEGDYYEKAQNFQFNPANVIHSKWVFSGLNRFKILRLDFETPSGRIDSKVISHENYRSPQNFLNVSEIDELRDQIIDGKHSWLFEIEAGQTISILIYFNQLETFKYTLPVEHERNENKL